MKTKPDPSIPPSSEELMDSETPYYTRTTSPADAEAKFPEPDLSDEEIITRMNALYNKLMDAVMNSNLSMTNDIEVVGKFVAIIFTSTPATKQQFMDYMSENWDEEETNAIINKAAYHTNH